MEILVAGDFCPRYRVKDIFERDSYGHVLKEVKQVTSQADYSIVNLECPITKGGERPIEKLGPNLQCTMKGIAALKWAGFDCVTLANNHFYDYGDDGVTNTLQTCKDNGIDYVGGGRNLDEASHTLYKNIGGTILAIINCCEHEFSIATDHLGGSNPLNSIRQYYAIKEAQKKADYILLIVHGGHEHYQLPSIRMQETYRFFIDAGADVVVNHHQHCFSGYEYYQGKPIFYGLGNFCFDNGRKTSSNWNEGYCVILSFGQSINIQLIPYTQCNKEAKVEIRKPHDFDKKIGYLNDIISSPSKLKTEQEHYYHSVKQYYRSTVCNPITNRIINALQSRGIFPTWISKKWIRIIHNHVMCEAHRDRLLYYLNHRSDT